MDAATRRMLIDSGTHHQPPAKPTQHGCAYFDDGCPWNICYACEYERDPAAYQSQIRKSTAVKIITGYFRCLNAGATAHAYSADILDAVLAYLDTPVADRAAATLTPEAKRALDAIAAQR